MTEAAEKKTGCHHAHRPSSLTGINISPIIPQPYVMNADVDDLAATAIDGLKSWSGRRHCFLISWPIVDLLNVP